MKWYLGNINGYGDCVFESDKPPCESFVLSRLLVLILGPQGQIGLVRTPATIIAEKESLGIVMRTESVNWWADCPEVLEKDAMRVFSSIRIAPAGNGPGRIIQ